MVTHGKEKTEDVTELNSRAKQRKSDDKNHHFSKITG